MARTRCLDRKMSLLMRRLAATSLALLFVAGALGVQAQPAAAAGDVTVGGAELEMIRLLNAERAKAGLVALRGDSRLMSIARARSVDMATKNYFSHVQPDGRNIFDLIAGAGITWYGAGEIIAWNNASFADSTAMARDGWMGSPLHRAIVLSKDYNYIGIGLAVAANGKKYWTGAFLKGPDRTGGWVSISAQAKVANVSSGSYRVATTSWTGGDIRLQVLTAGLWYYQVQARVGSNTWGWQSTGTVQTWWSLKVWKGWSYDIRIRACDRARNCSGWVTQRIVG